MTPEDSMRERISAELDAQRPPLGDLVGTAVAAGRRRKQRVRLGATALSAVGVLAVAGTVARFAPSAAPTNQGPATKTGAAPTPTAAPPRTPPTSPTTLASATATSRTTTHKPTVSSIVKHVDPGTITLEKGIYLNTTTDSMSWWEYEGGLTVQYNGSNTWGSDFIAMGESDRIVSGFYVGDKDIAAAAVTVDGQQYPATVVKVNGTHGWTGLYYLRPPGPDSYQSIKIDTFDSDGNLIATTGAGIVDSPPTFSTTTPRTPPRTPPVTDIPINSPFPGATPMPPPNGAGNK